MVRHREAGIDRDARTGLVRVLGTFPVLRFFAE